MVKIRKPTDSRMLWIGELERTKAADPKKLYTEEYEIVSEPHIVRRLWYEDGIIACSWVGENNYVHGLNSFLLRMTSAEGDRMERGENEEPIIDASSSGYFSRSRIHELIDLLSLWLHSRFYFVQCTTGEMDANGIPSRWGERFVYRPCRNVEQRKASLFTSKGKDMLSVATILDAVRALDPKLHNAFYFAAAHYADALRWIGVDDELAYIRLVSSIESLSSLEKIPEDSLEKRVRSWMKEDVPTKERQELDSWLHNRKAKARFVEFILKHCDGFFPKKRPKPARLFINKTGLPEYLKRIYTARSLYLHAGQPMWISEEWRSNPDRGRGWDLDPSLGRIIDRRQWGERQKLPTVLFFETLVRHCLLSFLPEVSKRDESMADKVVGTFAKLTSLGTVG